MAEQKNASDPKQVKDSKGKEKRNKQQLLNDYRSVLDTPQGRRLLYHILGMCQIYRVSFTGNSRSFFNDGMKQVGLMLLDEIREADKRAYVTMQNERLDMEEKE